MKAKPFALIILTLVIGCNNNTAENSSEAYLNNKVDDLNNQGLQLKDISNHFKPASGINISHRLDLSCNGEYLPVRKRQLNKSELKLSNSDSQKGIQMNEALILEYLYNEQPIELLEETDAYYKIKFDYKSWIGEGYIVKKYCDNPTLKPIDEWDKESHYLNQCNLIINPELLPFCKVFVKEKFHDLLIKGINSKNPKQHIDEVFFQTSTEIILISIFVGQSKRAPYYNPAIRPVRATSDQSTAIYCVKNDYYVYEFSNYDNMFMSNSPSLPNKIDSYSITKDTLKAIAADHESYFYHEHDFNINLYPLDNKRAFSSRKGAKWILNDTIQLIDISYIADKFFVDKTQIGHEYFYSILGAYIDDVLSTDL